MKKILFLGIMAFFFSCNHIETESSLSHSDVQYIERLGILDPGENILKFYSEFKIKNAGNFYTNKRVATYWIDERNEAKNEISYAFYPEIKSIDTIYNAGATYNPYLLITKKDDSQFKVSVNGEKDEIKDFFEDVLKKWNSSKN